MHPLYQKGGRIEPGGNGCSLHKAQLLSYLKFLNVLLGLIINFHELKLTDGVVHMIYLEQIGESQPIEAMEENLVSLARSSVRLAAEGF